MKRFLLTAILSAAGWAAMAPVSAGDRTISAVSLLPIEAPVGTVPQLPWQVWTTYSDGHGQWRQVRWENSTIEAERLQSDAERYPIGARYEIAGYLVGDDHTDQGYPVRAKVTVVPAGEGHPLPLLQAEPLPLADVRLTGENLLTGNRDLDIRNLLSLDITRMLYNYRDTYGLPTDGYAMAEGWDAPTIKLKGHGTGHYLSALAFAMTATDDVVLRSQLQLRIVRMVDELRQCQERTFVWCDSLGRYYEARDYAPEEELLTMTGDWEAFDRYKQDYRHYGYGYLNAIPAAHPALIECYRAYNNEKWVWAPYYTIHKQLAGLIDVANVMRGCGQQALGDKALLIARDMGLWVWNRLHYRTYVQQEGTLEERRSRPGNRAEMWDMYIAGEVGGMAESLSRLAEMVSDSTGRAQLIEAAGYFDAPILFGNVARNIDDIRTRHANQHIPMFIGALRSYRSHGKGEYYQLASNFWEMIQGRYVYAMGGVGNSEMWRQPYTQMESMNSNTERDAEGKFLPNPTLNETCCAYNLAKLTKELNGYNPDDARYMDYYERVLYNQIVGSVHPTDYGVCYHYAVGLNAMKPYGSPSHQETCCGGTGAENHVKYQEAAYFANDSTLWVALYLPSVAQWRVRGWVIEQQCEWPAQHTRLRFRRTEGAAEDQAQVRFALKLRVPYWATEGFDIQLNGHSLAARYQPCSYYEIASRNWSESDVVQISMPYTRHLCYGPDKMTQWLSPEDGKPVTCEPTWLGALMYGPLVMASPEVHTWEEALLSLSPDLSDVTVGEEPWTLWADGRRFIPDCFATMPTTHYMRISKP